MTKINRLVASELRRLADQLTMEEVLQFNKSYSIEPQSTPSADKDLIVLHFTAGLSVSGAVNHWKTLKSGIGCPFIISKLGTIYSIFPSEKWAFHLGIRSKYGDIHDRRSIGIELVNPGPLRLKDDTMYWWPKNYTTEYCKLTEYSKYVQRPWRGEQFFATFTDEQYASLNNLLHWLKVNFNIPLRALDFRATVEEAINWKGVASHHHFRADKFDIGPALDWSRLCVT